MVNTGVRVSMIAIEDTEVGHVIVVGHAIVVGHMIEVGHGKKNIGVHKAMTETETDLDTDTGLVPGVGVGVGVVIVIVIVTEIETVIMAATGNNLAIKNTKARKRQLGRTWQGLWG